MLLCAKIVNVHGISGEVKAVIYADDPSFFENIDEFALEGGRTLHPLSIRPHKNTIIISLRGIKSIDEALELKGLNLYVRREKANPLPEGRHYIVDIIGLSVETDSGEYKGRVTDVLKTGKNDVYVVKNQNGQEYLIPVIDQVVIDIDVSEGKIVVKPMKGLFDDEN